MPIPKALRAADREIALVDAAAIEPEQFVTALYRAAFGREPDEPGLFAHVNALRQGASPEEIAGNFLQASEFRSRIPGLVQSYPLDEAAPMPVELVPAAAQERLLWEHVARTWANLGATEPYWSVLADPRWKASRMAEADILDAFYDTGRTTLQRLDRWLARSHVSIPSTCTCAEYGCGVGRCTIWLARRYARVIAFDISEPHLALAQARARSEGLDNIEFVQVKSEADLERLRGIDFFYSVIVLQHNPPPLILAILRHVFEGLRLHGVAYFQVPTYASGYAFELRKYLDNATDRGMEMHFVPQHAILDLGWTRGMQPLEVSPDSLIGDSARWISTTFLMARRNGRPLVPEAGR
jgi:hypothetical protein